MDPILDFPKPKMLKLEVDGRQEQIPEFNTMWRILWQMQNNINALAGRGAGGAVLGGPLNMGNVVRGTNSDDPDDDEFLTVAKAKELFDPSVMQEQLSSQGPYPLNIQGLPGLAAQAQTPLVEEYDANLAGYYDQGTLVTIDGVLQLIEQASPGQVPVPAYAVPTGTVMQAAQATFSAIDPIQAIEVAIMWDTPFEDANYMVTGSILETSAVGAGLVFERFRAQTATGVTGVVWNGAGVPLAGTLYAIAYRL